jgi:alpha-methylacyl-CoA racemase
MPADPEALEAAECGPLAGTRVVELAAMGPGPHAALLLAELGADVVRVERPVATSPGATPRGRTLVEADLRTEAGREAVLALLARADVLIEGFRPGVAERLGIGPDECSGRNPRLVYARMTGWGQAGPLADRAGHDINYIALTGVLDAVGRAGSAPIPPLNLIGDFGGGSMYLVVGVLAALLERTRSGRGQVVDAAIVDGTSHLASAIWSLRAAGRWHDERGTNRLDTGAPFYDVYETSDGGHMAVGALEPRFYAQLLEGLGLEAESLPAQDDQDGWPALRAAFAEAFVSGTRDHWTDRFARTDACVTPVLPFGEVAQHPHVIARGTVTTVGGAAEPSPAPRLSRNPAIRATARGERIGIDAVLATWPGSGGTIL